LDRTTKGRLGIAAAIALCVAAFAASPAGATTGSVQPRASTPLDGDGMWIWLMSRSGGTAAAVAEQAKRYGIEVVFIKSSDGTNVWSQFTPALVRELHAEGLRVCAWQFVYGSEPKGEAIAGAAAEEAGADCLVIDAETHYEGRYAQAQIYMRALRNRVGPTYPLALTSFPYVDYHPSFPYSVFLAPGNAQYNAPQMYWHTIGSSVAENFDHTYRYNRPYARPIFPLGQTYEDPPRGDVIAFRRLARAYRAPGVSWWSWQETTGREWNWVGRKLGRTQPPTVGRGYAILSSGSRGDLVVWAQQHLVAAGHAVKVDGTYGAGTANVVRDFQQSAGLNATGVVRASTWRALLQHEPVTTRWTLRRAARMSAAVERTPFSASAPGLTSEFAPTTGVP
jgi:hypothetical protein